MAINIPLKVDRDFEIWFNTMRNKYGEAFEYLNGLHESQLNFSDFIDGFVDKNVADATIDGNANAHHKDVCSLIGEKGKSEDKLFAFNKIFYELKKKYGLRTAREWLELEWIGAYYLHDAPSATFKPYCYAYDLTRLANEGLFFLDDYNNQPPKHLTTFLDDVIEFISFFSNRSSGACGCPNVLLWTFYFYKKDIKEGYYIKDPEYYIRQCFQKFIFRMNQPFLRVDQSAFVNVSIFDRNYYEALFGGVEFPDGTFAIDYVDEFMEHQKLFMEVVSDIRQDNIFTFPVLTYSLLYKDGKFVDEEFARWCSDHNCKWNDSNFFQSDNVGVLSNCCFDGNQKILTKSSNGVAYMTFRNFANAPYRDYKRNFTIFHNGSWVKGKCVKTKADKLYAIRTVNNKQILVTADHLNVTQRGNVPTAQLTTDDYLMFSTRPLNAVHEVDYHLTYEQGFLIGMYAGDGSMADEFSEATTNISLSLNKNKFNESESILDKALEIFGTELTLGKEYNNVYPVRIHSNEVALFIRSFISGNYAFEKALNLDCLLQSAEFRHGILDGYYLTDGGNSNRIYTTSPAMAECLEVLCTSLGLQTIINVTNRTNESVIIRGEVFKRNYPLYCVRWYEPGNRRTLANNYLAYNNSIFFKIASIEEYNNTDPEGMVYCLEMENQMEPYFTLPNGIITHNCRLLSDTSKLDAFINSIGGTALSIGSVKVNTINLMNIAYTSGMDEERYLNILRERATLCCKVLDVIRHIISRNVEKGLLPNYCDGGIELAKQYCTLGILGTYEVIEAFGYTLRDEFNNVYYTNEGIEFADKIFKVLNEVKDNFTTEYSFNIESVPAERAAVILCQKDNLLFEKDDKFIYSNQWIPLSETCTIQEKLRLSSILDAKCSGGAIAHINLSNNFPNTDMAWDMLNYIASQGVFYFAFNTRINECEDHHGFVGTDICPICGKGVYDTYQRIAGFLEPTRSYSKDRKREFSTRQWYEYAQLKHD